MKESQVNQSAPVATTKRTWYDKRFREGRSPREQRPSAATAGDAVPPQQQTAGARAPLAFAPRPRRGGGDVALAYGAGGEGGGEEPLGEAANGGMEETPSGTAEPRTTPERQERQGHRSGAQRWVRRTPLPQAEAADENGEATGTRPGAGGAGAAATWASRVRGACGSGGAHASASSLAKQPGPQGKLSAAAGVRSSPRSLRDPNMKVVSGQMVNLQKTTFMTDAQLTFVLRWVMQSTEFRWFAGRSTFDLKFNGTQSLDLPESCQVLKPLATALVALAQRTMRDGEELAVIQLLLNRFKDGGDEVKPHRHRCRQVCLSLGADRELSVEGQVQLMRHGDVMPLDQEVHSVPANRGVGNPRVSVCLFYGSTREYRDKHISVNANDGWHGSSIWWEHPQDYKRPQSGKSGWKKTWMPVRGRT